MNLKNFFNGKSNQNTNGEQFIKIDVNRGYEPSEVTIKQGVPAKIVFHRTNDAMCLSKVQSQDLAFDKALPLNQDVEIPINTDQSGEFNFACGMNMFHGKVVIN